MTNTYKNTTTGDIEQEVNPEKALKQGIYFLNQIADQFKNKNLVGKKRADLETSREKICLSLVDLVAGAIQANIFTADEYGILKANVQPKVFKDAGRINKILKTILDKKKVSQDSKMLDDIELAKLIETPYVVRDANDSNLVKLDLSKFGANGVQAISKDQVPTPTEDGAIVEINSNHPDDKGIIVDKVNNIAYIEKANTWYAKLILKTSSWYETAKTICTNVFGYVWKKLFELANKLVQLALVAILAIVGVSLKVTNTTSGFLNRAKNKIIKWLDDREESLENSELAS